MKILSLAILFVLAILPLPLLADANTNLATQPYWLKLGHYREAILSKWKSEIDSPQFFLAKLGKTDPLAELTATIDAFNGKKLTPDETNKVRCQFPARYTWLKSKIDNSWPELNCIKLNQWEKTVNPAGITLVFPTAFMNNPSSMFGHTLLRIDAKDQNRNRELVAFAVNFAAQPNATDNAAAYAFKGLVGMYPGNFTVMPYYRKVREYNDIESRDIWEYKLNFSEQEIRRILLHLWELQSATFDYYFIDENCSYQLLSLLQLANENLDLTSSFDFQAIPSDTVLALKKNLLLQQPNYRPAFGTRLFHYSTQLSSQELQSARDLINDGDFNRSRYSTNRQAAILEMAYEWLNFNFNDRKLNRDSIAPRLKNLLYQRSKLDTTSPFTEPLKPIASPEQGHSSSRIGLTFANNNNYDNEIKLAYRLAYHDLLDHSIGYIPGAKISFFDIAASFSKNNKSRLDHFYLIDAMSLAPDNNIFDSWSWNIRLGYDRQPDIHKQSGRYFTQGGYGKSFGNPNNIHGFILGSVELNDSDITDNLEIGIGTELGTIWQINSLNKLAITGSIIKLIDSKNAYHSQVDLSWNWALKTNWALRSNINYTSWVTRDTQAKLTLYYYF